MARQGKKHSGSSPSRWVTALAADRQGNIFELEGYAAAGMAGATRVALTTANTRSMPHGGELMFLPDRHPILYNIKTAAFEVLKENPYAPGEPLYPVAAFNSPGYMLAYVCAYTEAPGAGVLPLFSYGAVGWGARGFRAPVILVDSEPRQDLRQMKHDDVVAGVRRMRKRLPDNRLRTHLEKCALEYGCPAGKNFFLGRYEAPLPTATTCNARCLGCLSLQPNDDISCSQNRIDFTPDPDDIAAVALEHIRRVPQAVVSFGQGCEGDPLMAAAVIGPAIEQIRRSTADGTINMNTNGSRPDVLRHLFDAGLDSIRISMNSFRPDAYAAYFRPRGYGFTDVARSIDLARGSDKFVAVNYLNMAGITDTPQELDALTAFIGSHPIRMIQWRNLNFDPLKYWAAMRGAVDLGPPVGMAAVLGRVEKNVPVAAARLFQSTQGNLVMKWIEAKIFFTHAGQRGGRGVDRRCI